VFIDSLSPAPPPTTPKPVYEGDTTVDPTSGGGEYDVSLDEEEEQQNAHEIVQRNLFYEDGIISLLKTVPEVTAWMEDVRKNFTIRPAGSRNLADFQELWRKAFYDVPANPIQTICHELLQLLIQAEHKAFANEKAELLRQIGSKIPEDGGCESPYAAFIKELIGMFLSSFSTQILIYAYMWYKAPTLLHMTVGSPWDILMCCCPACIRERLESEEVATEAEPGMIEMT